VRGSHLTPSLARAVRTKLKLSFILLLLKSKAVLNIRA
jgi:hypothetical protein